MGLVVTKITKWYNDGYLQLNSKTNSTGAQYNSTPPSRLGIQRLLLQWNNRTKWHGRSVVRHTARVGGNCGLVVQWLDDSTQFPLQNALIVIVCLKKPNHAPGARRLLVQSCLVALFEWRTFLSNFIFKLHRHTRFGKRGWCWLYGPGTFVCTVKLSPACIKELIIKLKHQTHFYGN